MQRIWLTLWFSPRVSIAPPGFGVKPTEHIPPPLGQTVRCLSYAHLLKNASLSGAPVPPAKGWARSPPNQPSLERPPLRDPRWARAATRSLTADEGFEWPNRPPQLRHNELTGGIKSFDLPGGIKDPGVRGASPRDALHCHNHCFEAKSPSIKCSMCSEPPVHQILRLKNIPAIIHEDLIVPRFHQFTASKLNPHLLCIKPGRGLRFQA